MPLTEAGAALIGAGISAASAYAQAKMNKRHQEDLMKKSNKLNVENWERENRYNSPAAQMFRLKSAGLNPNLIYQSGAPVASGSIESPNTGSNVADFSGIAADTINAFQAQNQSTQLEQYIENLKAEAEKTRAETSGIQSENILKAAKSDFAPSYVRRELRNMLYQGDLLSAQNQYYGELKRQVSILTDISEFERDNWSKKFNAELDLILSQGALNRSSISRIDSEIKKMAQEVSESKTRQKLLREQISNLAVDTARARISKGLEQYRAQYLTKQGLGGNKKHSTLLEEQIFYEIKKTKREFKLMPVNTVTSGIRDVGIGLGGIMNAIPTKKMGKIGF